MKTLMMLLLFVSAAFAYIPENKSIEILMGARQMDIVEYAAASGVVLNDTPYMHPYWAWVRVAFCEKRYFVLEGVRIDFACSATPVDFISTGAYAHATRAFKGIELCNTGHLAEGRRIIQENLMSPISYEC